MSTVKFVIPQERFEARRCNLRIELRKAEDGYHTAKTAFVDPLNHMQFKKHCMFKLVSEYTAPKGKGHAERLARLLTALPIVERARETYKNFVELDHNGHVSVAS